MHISPGAIVTVPFGRQNRLVSAVADRVYYPGGAPDASDGPKPDGEAAADGAGYGAAKQKNAVQYGAAADRRGAGDGGEISDGGDIAEGAPRLKYVASVINSASLTPELLSLAHFMRARTLCTFGDAVKTMLPSAALSNISEIYFAAEEDASVPPQSAPVYAFVRENSPVTADALYAKFGRGVQPVLAKLSAKGAIIRRRQDHEPTNVKHETVFGLAADRAEAERAMNGEGEYALRGKRQKELLGELLDGEKTLTELKKVIPEPRATAAALEKKGLVRSEKREIFRNPYLSAAAAPAAPPVTKYSDEQTRAIHTLCELADGAAPAAALLHGITGSGKTLVIKAVIDSVLASGRGAIVLVPEIALTPQTVGVYRSFFGDRIAVMHSSLSSGERYDAWRRVRDGDADVVIGTRSAVFAPVRNLGLIVIDEEQEHTYKSDTTPKYLAHDIARKRCADTKSLMLLASATPSLASYRKAKTGVYTLVESEEPLRKCAPSRGRDRRYETRDRVRKCVDLLRRDCFSAEKGQSRRRTGDTVFEPPRLQQRYNLPQMRRKYKMPELLGLAHLPRDRGGGRASGRKLPQPPRAHGSAHLPLLRIPLCGADEVPVVLGRESSVHGIRNAARRGGA